MMDLDLSSIALLSDEEEDLDIPLEDEDGADMPKDDEEDEEEGEEGEGF